MSRIGNGLKRGPQAGTIRYNQPMIEITTRRWYVLSFTLLALAAAWIALSAAAPAGVTGGRPPAPRAGFAAPDFELPAADGQAVRLSDLRGQPVLLNFWASWCPPCQAEMPAMQQVHLAYADRGYVVLAVNTTYQDAESDALAFVRDRGLTFPILFDRDGSAARLYEVRAMPTSFFIDAQGIIREVVVGGPMAEGLLRAQAEQMLENR